MTARHCPGCRDYTHAWGTSCPGVEISILGEEFAEVPFVPPLPLRSRLKVLFGRHLVLGFSLGPLGEPFEETAAEPPTTQFWAGPDSWKDSA